MDLDKKFAEITKNLKGSAVRDLLKYADRPEVISFGGGMPNPLSFPINEIGDIINYILSNYGEKALQYSSTDGVEEFRNEVSKRINSRYGFNSTKGDIISLNGSQTGLYMVSKIFLNRGDYVISEAPTYVGAITAFNAQAPFWIPVDLENDGMNMQMLENGIKKVISEGKIPKFIYVIPTFQNPAGITWSIDKRKELLEISSKYDLIIFEDDPYGELRFNGEHIKPIKSFDSEGRVIYMGTFSKVLSPGIRLGFIYANQEINKKLNLLKQGVDLCTNTFSQYLAAEYLKRGIIDKQIPKIVNLYKKKRDIMIEALETYMPEGTDFTRPDGGMFLWVTLKGNIDTEKLLKKALEFNVAYVIGSAFYPDGRGKNSMRLNYTFSKDEDIVEGIKRLSKAIKEYQ
ncbi:MAG: PLP-dependent aminotransferase family protein [Thermoplasmata archaeon]